MKIGISLLGLEPGKMGGIEDYVRQMVEHLQKIDKNNRYVIFIEDINYMKMSAPNFKVVSLRPRITDKLRNRLDRKPKSSVNNIYTLLVERERCDIVHFPFQIINVPGLSAKKIISVMDLQHEHFPQYFSQEENDSRLELFGSSIRDADHIISISNFTKQDIIVRHEFDPSRISVVHLAANLPNRASIPKFKFPSKYFYYPAATWPHKNHVRLLRAYLEFQKKYPDYHLVLSGANKSAGGEVADFINKNNLSEKIHILGFLKDEEVKFIYKDASGLIFPSLFEGFGMPILEAMALKCQVACSNLEVLREVGDKFAVYFDPTRISEIANALTSMAAKAPSSEFLEEARQHANAFSFDRTARETLEVYGKVGPQ